ncbi:MAG TPA: hypothetical protein VGL39_14250 [Jatrophihabitantaceae bacterium]|jgi:hypothetical protein
MAQAQAQYLSLVKPSNATIDAVNRMRDANDQSVSRWRTICRRAAADDHTLARKMAAGHWPASARRQVDAFVDALAEERTTWSLCATASSADDVNAAFNDYHSASGKAEAVRIALGLPGA